MAEPVLMPQVGQDIRVARIVEWLKKENEPVEKGQVIAAVESDKAAFDVEAYSSGVLLKLLHPEGAQVQVLTPIAYIGQPGEKVENLGVPREAVNGSLEAVELPEPMSYEPAGHEIRISASPSARKLARERGINLRDAAGTGPGGRITKQDVLSAVSPESASGRNVEPGDVVVPFSPMRSRIAQRLIRSNQNIPHSCLFMDVDMSYGQAWRQRFNRTNQVKVTITDMIIKAVTTALAEFKKINAHVDAARVIMKSQINIGVAISVEDGLIVPVIPGTDKKSLIEISTALQDSAEGAGAGKLKPQEPGKFTVSNLGMYSVDAFVPIINPPQCAILAVGAAGSRPSVIGDGIRAREVMTMTPACDHRAVDGTYAAQFMERIKHYLENPRLLES